jgi:hypothetical protein
MSTLDEIVSLTNRISLEFNNGSRDTCILTSYALNDVLHRLGYNAYPLRVEAGVFPSDSKLCGTILGSQGDGSRKPATGKDMWQGHLVIAVDKDWLLDATLDQANKPEWPQSSWVGPVAVKLDNSFWNGIPIFVEFANKKQISWWLYNNKDSLQLTNPRRTCVRYSLYPKQKEFANAGDARPSHWKPLANMIMDKLI